MAVIYHITTKEAWTAALEKGIYEASSLHTEGFIHCSEVHQLKVIIEKFYRNKPGCIILTIDPSLLIAPLRSEWSASLQDHFPHIYGRLNTDAVTGTEEL